MDRIRSCIAKPDRLLWALFALACLAFCFYLTVLFGALSSVASDFSWGDVVYHHQLFHNVLHGRPFQTSVYWHALLNSVNPSAYLHMVNIHMYLSPFLFAGLYALYPNLYGLYATVLIVQYLGMAFFVWMLVRHFTTQGRLGKYLLIMTFVLGSSFVFTLAAGKASPILMGTPFLLAAYYFLQKERYGLYVLCSVLFCLSYDDCGLVFVSFLAYVYLFERKHLRPAVLTAVIGLTVFLLVIGVLQPMARSYMPGKSVASVFDALGLVWHNLTSGRFVAFVQGIYRDLLLFALLFLVFPVLWLLRDRSAPQDRTLPRCIGLIFLAPLSHWTSIIVNVGVHFVPVVVFALIAVTLSVSHATLALPARWGWKEGWAAGLILFYLIGNLYLFTSRNIPYLDHTYDNEAKTNVHCLRQIERLVPADRSLCYWTARGLDGFLGNRSDIWRFPHFFEQTDFLVMQKRAPNTFFRIVPETGEDIETAIKRGTHQSTDARGGIDEGAVRAICRQLVQVRGSHRVVFDDPDLVILQRNTPHRFVQPPETYGLGFWGNGSAVLKAKSGGG